MHNEIKKSVRMDQWAAEQVSLWPELLTPESLLLTFKNCLNFDSVLCFGMIERKKRKRYLGRFGSRLVTPQVMTVEAVCVMEETVEKEK